MFNLGGKNSSKIQKLKAFFCLREPKCGLSFLSSLHTEKATVTSVSLTEVKPHWHSGISGRQWEVYQHKLYRNLDQTDTGFLWDTKSLQDKFYSAPNLFLWGLKPSRT